MLSTVGREGGIGLYVCRKGMSEGEVGKGGTDEGGREGRETEGRGSGERREFM